MERAKFVNYCDKIKKMVYGEDDWEKDVPAAVSKYLSGDATLGFARVISELLIPAREIVWEHSATQTKEPLSLSESADLLSYRVPIEDYRFSAYLFAVCTAAVCFGGYDIDKTEYDSFDANELFKYDSSVAVRDETDEVKKQLKRFGIRLLDFSRTNQLVHFRPVKTGTMQLVCADVRESMRYISSKSGKVYLNGWKKLEPYTIYKCKLCGRIDKRKYDISAKKTQPTYPCPICDADNTHGRKSLQPVKEKLTALPGGVFRCADCGAMLLAASLSFGYTCPNCGADPKIENYPIVSSDALRSYGTNEMLCAIGDTSAKETAKTLMNKAKTMERNFGLHVLYLACGFLKWKDSAGTEYNSPILLLPIDMSLDKRAGKYYFEADETSNGFEVNRTLIQMLSGYSSTCSVAIPDPDGPIDGAYFSALKRAFASSGEVIADITKDWVISEEFGIGLFHYQKLQLHDDMETNRDKYLEHPMIRRLCGDKDVRIAPSISHPRHSLEYLMLDADSSQEEVIKAAQNGRSFILQGPPGSGKSQTITNVIASALGEGKTVLFVTEKASARSVIIDNLERCGGSQPLTDFVLDFDGFKKRSGAIGRDPFITELNRCLAPYTPSGVYDDRWIAEEKLRYLQVHDFMKQSRGEYSGRNYMRLLKDMAQYAEIPDLRSAAGIPSDWTDFVKLCDTVRRFYSVSSEASAPLDYKKDPLYGCLGDRGDVLAQTANEYLSVCADIFGVVNTMKTRGWSVESTADSVQSCMEQLRIWVKMPSLTSEILDGFSEKKCALMLDRILSRKKTLENWQKHVGAKYIGLIDDSKAMSADISQLALELNYRRSIFKRIGQSYRELKNSIFGCFKRIPQKSSYKDTLAAFEKLREYREYLELMSAWEGECAKDTEMFGLCLSSPEELDELYGRLSAASRVFAKHDEHVIGAGAIKKWLSRFEESVHESTEKELDTCMTRLSDALDLEASLGESLKGFFEPWTVSLGDYPTYYGLSLKVKSEASRLSIWASFVDVLNELRTLKLTDALDELISDGDGCDSAMDRLSKTYYKKLTNTFILDNKLTALRDFSRDSHEHLLTSYAQADRAVLGSGSKRLYEKLKGTLKAAAGVLGTSGEYPKLRSKTSYSIKQTVAENWHYIKAIKPCFMMSPLNVSQYVDIGIKFDLVIFDEASQIFTEDALASIVRGKQIIIAGDSKQLPPCDFFRAGESARDDDESYYEEEAEKDSSLLVAADEALSDASVSLAWHYRSCDEALIAFANEQMDYNLITFPSAKRNKNDGIRFIDIPYSPDSCYVAGKGGTHINPGEAEAIVKLIYSEMTDPERSDFSIGVVAFSNAQAFEIEERWEVFKQLPENKPMIDEWEKKHESEPLIFCNLDTVQGDERDTTILSICYSPDMNGRFVLPYLGRIRLLSGKKRINVAVTRARHQMFIVSMLAPSTLRTAINNSSAPDENKAGAQMLCALLEYAQTFVGERSIACRPTEDPFALSVCRVLDEAGIAYATEIGRSDCKISIGIKDPSRDGDYVLGIIIDDPARTDFDSVREYSRLTEQVLCGKYGWEIYRLYPISWLRSYEAEKLRLLEKIRQSLGSC